MSDHEVNLKILMDLLVKKGVVKGQEERNRILMEMTEEVAALVLADNANQARALTLDGLRSAARYEEFVALIENMLGAGVLNRADDAIPTQAELLASPERKRGLPAPAAGRAPRPHEDVGLRDGHGVGVPGQPRGPALPGGLLPEADPRGLRRRTWASTPCAGRSWPPRP